MPGQSKSLFKPGNQVSVGNRGRSRDDLTQALISQLNEAGRQKNKKKIHELVEAAIKLGTGYEYQVDRDDGSGTKRTVVVQPSLAAQEFIWNRIEGMPVQRMGNPDGSAFEPGSRPLVMVQFASGPLPAMTAPGDDAVVVDVEAETK